MLVDHPERDFPPVVAAHLAGCPACQREFALLRQMRALLQAAEAPAAPAGFAAGVMARIAAADREPVRGWRVLLTGWKRVAAATAALLLVAGSAFALVRSGTFQPPLLASKEQRTVVSPVTPAAPAKPEPTGETAVPAPRTRQAAAPAPRTGKTKPKPAPPAPKEKNKPAARQPVAVAVERPTRVFLNRQRVVFSTFLRVKVVDINAAKARATALASTWGATQSYATSTTDRNQQVEICQFIVAKEKSAAFISELAGLGVVVLRQDEKSDVTQEFNSVKTEYERLAALRKAAPENERAALDATLNTLEGRLSQLETAASRYTVTLCLSEQG
ncbi:hypothetical protein, partial [Thermodesulfitimonas sp.]